MKASLLARAATIMLLSAGLVAGTGVTGFAATTADTAGQTSSTAPATAGAPGTAPAAAPDDAQAGAAGTATTTPSIEQIANQRLESLHSKLQITSHEQSQWNKFATVMRDNARQLDQAYQKRADKIDTMNAVENMKSYHRIEEMRTRDMGKLLSAFQSMYASLSPQQKHEADELFRTQAQEHAAAAQQHQAEMQHQTANGTTH